MSKAGRRQKAIGPQTKVNPKKLRSNHEMPSAAEPPPKERRHSCRPACAAPAGRLLALANNSGRQECRRSRATPEDPRGARGFVQIAPLRIKKNQHVGRNDGNLLAANRLRSLFFPAQSGKSVSAISQLAHRLRRSFQWPQRGTRRRKKDQLSWVHRASAVFLARRFGCGLAALRPLATFCGHQELRMAMARPTSLPAAGRLSSLRGTTQPFHGARQRKPARPPD